MSFRNFIMKKIWLIILFLFIIFDLTGCKENIKKSNITKNIVKATLNEEGNIVIDENSITEKVTYISYYYDEVVIGLIAVKDSKGENKVVINTCYSCGGSPNAYFIQIDNKLQCQNCGSLFEIDELDNLKEDSCNPIKIENITYDNGKIIVEVNELKKLKDKFVDWNGPKV